VAAVLASADVFVHAGDQETFGLSVLEALACGLPVVARASEGLIELVDDHVGARVESGTAAEFAEAIAALFRVGPESFKGAARARGERGDWSRVLPKIWDRYERLRLGTHACAEPLIPNATGVVP
jgi:alpha-1,6-mannosyltransferase